MAYPALDEQGRTPSTSSPVPVNDSEQTLNPGVLLRQRLMLLSLKTQMLLILLAISLWKKEGGKASFYRGFPDSAVERNDADMFRSR